MALTIRSSLKRSLAMLATASLIAGAVVPGVQAQGMAPGTGPASVADLAEGLLDAVVNIATSQNVKEKDESGPLPQIPEGSPFQEFFNDFFKGDNDLSLITHLRAHET